MKTGSIYKSILGALLVVVVGFLLFFGARQEPTDSPETPVYEESVAREIPDGWREYKNEQYLFSLLYPDGITVLEFVEQDTMTVTFEDTDTSTGFQLFIIPYSAQTISEERFLKDVPLGVREGEEKVFIDGVEAVAFWSKDIALGDTREVWFIRAPYLYEVTTLADLDPWLQNIIATWQFL